MKSTKRILSAILSVVMILGCITVGFTAQASVADLATAVKNAADGETVNWDGGDVTLKDTLVINKNVTIDFNGAVITGPVDKVAIRVDGGNVTLYDGVVIADNRNWSGETGFVKALMNYKPAISINNGIVELDCITAVGSVIRVPNSSSVEVPIGNGINANGGTVVLDNVIAMGMKALDNTKADVTVNDAILIGIYKAVNQYNTVDFQKDSYTQYETVEFLEAFLKEGVQLSSTEKKYIASATNSQGDFSVGSVIVNVATPKFNELTSDYKDGVLSVYALAEAHEHEGVSDRYSYTYTPDVCEIDGQEAKFVPAENGQYVATFDSLEKGQTYTAEANYDLSVKLGKKQAEVVDGALDTLADYADRAPALLYRFIKDFEEVYAKAEELVALAYNMLTDDLTKDRFASLGEILGLIYALEGQEFGGTVDNAIVNDRLFKEIGGYIVSAYDLYEAGVYSYSDVEFTYEFNIYADLVYINSNYPVFDLNGDGVADSAFAYFNDNTFAEADNKVLETSEFYAGKPGYGSGKGLLDVFNEYYDAIMAKLYGTSTTEFNDIGGAAEFVGNEWKNILALAEYAVEVVDKADALINSDSSAVNDFISELTKSGSFSSYINAFNTGVKYLHKIMDRVDEVKESDFVAKYGDNAGKYCKTYALKVWDIASNPNKYFDVEVKDGYVNVDLAAAELNITGEVSTQVKDVYVQVQALYGSATVNGAALNHSTYCDPIWFAYGDKIEISALKTMDGCEFSYMYLENGGNMTIIEDETYTTYASTNIILTVVFTPEESDKTEFVFMTDEALKYKYIKGVEFDSSTIAAWALYTADVEAPAFEGMDMVGWSFYNDGSDYEENLADLADAAAAKTDDVVVVYAIYQYDEYVTVPEHNETIKFVDSYAKDGILYFETSVQIRDTSKKAIGAGVIYLAEQAEGFDYEAEMTPDKKGETGYFVHVSSRMDASGKYHDSDALLRTAITTSKTIYARGYVLWEDGTVTYTTDIISNSVNK